MIAERSRPAWAIEQDSNSKKNNSNKTEVRVAQCDRRNVRIPGTRRKGNSLSNPWRDVSALKPQDYGIISRSDDRLP